MKIKTCILATALLGLASSGFAADNPNPVDRLEVAKQRVASGSQSVKPNQAARMRAEADKLQDMIDQIEAGKKVDPSKVDQAIDRSYQGY